MFLQPEDPDVQYLSENGEVTLSFDGIQVVQGWETDMLSTMSEMLCDFGGNILEVGLGLGISARKIANYPSIKRHIVVEKYQKVIDLFHINHGSAILPDTTKIVHADIFDFISQIEPNSLDGIFYDPYFPVVDMYEDPVVLEKLLPGLFAALRSGGALMPFPSLRPLLKEKYFAFASKFIVLRYPFETYQNTTYMQNIHKGNAFIKAVIKD
jgi:predicted methyltransferase